VIENAPSVHASAVLVGARAILIRGPSRAGKSSLAWRLIKAGQTGQLPFTRLVADDRAVLEVHHGRLLVRAAPALAGLLEIRGLSLRKLAYEKAAVVGLVLDFVSAEPPRLPLPADLSVNISGVRLPRMATQSIEQALSLVSAWIATSPAVAP
jgi:HPr kinase/phosphorylase